MEPLTNRATRAVAKRAFAKRAFAKRGVAKRGVAKRGVAEIDAFALSITASPEHLAKLPATAGLLSAPRPMTQPVELSYDPAANELFLDTGTHRIRLSPIAGKPEWLVAAHQLGGLLVKLAPTTQPHMLSLFGSWEGQLHVLTGEVL